MNHYIVIRSAYSPNSSIELNEYRLSITERWCVPSLAAQTNKDFAIELRTNCADPLIDRRVQAFQSVPVLLEHSAGYALRSRVMGNQFVSRLSDRGVFEVMHRHVPDPLIVDVRHKHNRSTTAPSMRGGHPLHEIREVFPCALL